MLTYQVRTRVVRLREPADISFPADAVIRVHLLPEQPFGASPDGGRTVVRAVGTLIQFDATSGRHSARSALQPLDVTLDQLAADSVSLRGRILEVRQSVESLKQLAQTIEAAYFAYPWLLSVSFVDPVFVERVEGELGGIPFEWQLGKWQFAFETTTQEEQSTMAATAWRRLDLFGQPGRRRLGAALHYFHRACRLEREARSPGEFMAEVLLNLAKTLNALFPGPEGKTIDAARSGLTELGYSNTEIEAYFVPVLALRSELDIAHVQLAELSKSQLSIVHSYVESAERQFRSLLRRVLDQVDTGQWNVPVYEDSGPSDSTVRVIERMEAALKLAPQAMSGNPDG